jgi:hypothetical protein
MFFENLCQEKSFQTGDDVSDLLYFAGARAGGLSSHLGRDPVELEPFY